MLGYTLKLIRLYNNMSANLVATQTQLEPKYLLKIERCKVKLSLSSLAKFSEFYQMPISQILILNDMKEHFKLSDAKLWKDIERFYVTKQDEIDEVANQKQLGA